MNFQDDESPQSETTPKHTTAGNPAKTSKTILSPMTLLAVVVIIFAILLVSLAITKTNKKSSKTSTTPVAATAQPASVDVSKQGFIPAVLQVRVNTQVTWTNNDSADHQVAADPYPRNDSIPGFDSHVVLQKGDTYSFTFSKAGTYTYHDELNPTKLKGTIVVQ